MYPESSWPPPLRPVEFYILLALARGDAHGYALRAIVRNDSLGSVVVDLAKLYRLIQKLHDEGLIDMLGERPAGPSGKPRMHYGLAKYGAIRLQEEAQRMQHAAKIARAAGYLDNDTPTDIQRMLLALE